MSVSTFHPFPDAEEAWFWCVQATEALHSGARLRAGMTETPRPCEPVDIQSVVLRLADQKLLRLPHLKTMAHYGRIQLRPSEKKHRDAALWQQAMQRLTPLLQRKGIVQ